MLGTLGAELPWPLADCCAGLASITDGSWVLRATASPEISLLGEAPILGEATYQSGPGFFFFFPPSKVPLNLLDLSNLEVQLEITP